MWHEGWHGYVLLVYDNEKVVPHSQEFVIDEGVHVNQVECLWSLVNPWLQKFRGLSKPRVKYHGRGGPWLRRGPWHGASGTTDGEFNPAHGGAFSLE